MHWGENGLVHLLVSGVTELPALEVFEQMGFLRKHLRGHTILSGPAGLVSLTPTMI